MHFVDISTQASCRYKPCRFSLNNTLLERCKRCCVRTYRNIPYQPEICQVIKFLIYACWLKRIIWFLNLCTGFIRSKNGGTRKQTKISNWYVSCWYGPRPGMILHNSAFNLQLKLVQCYWREWFSIRTALVSFCTLLWLLLLLTIVIDGKSVVFKVLWKR